MGVFNSSRASAARSLETTRACLHYQHGAFLPALYTRSSKEPKFPNSNSSQCLILQPAIYFTFHLTHLPELSRHSSRGAQRARLPSISKNKGINHAHQPISYHTYDGNLHGPTVHPASRPASGSACGFQVLHNSFGRLGRLSSLGCMGRLRLSHLCNLRCLRCLCLCCLSNLGCCLWWWQCTLTVHRTSRRPGT